MDKDTIIKIDNLTYSFNQNDNVLENVSFEIKKSELVAVIGHNGSGKSTLIKLILGLIESKKSNILIKGKLAYIPQKFNFDINFPAKVNEILDLECCDCSLRTQILKNMGIKEFETKQFKSLSGGQQQRVMIALSLLSNPDILILDEPTIGIDTKTQEEFYKLLKDLNKNRNITILFVTHDTQMVSSYFSKIICVVDRKVHIHGSKEIDRVLKSNYENNYHKLDHSHSNTNISNKKSNNRSSNKQKKQHMN